MVDGIMSLLLDFGLGCMTCFIGQWVVGEHDGSRGLQCAHAGGLVLLCLCHHREKNPE